jgi:tRNA-Thr(GGU) m(6)t(6)A37 methyltransferase TsaA
MFTEIIIRPIGIIKTPFTEIAQMPIQPSGAMNVLGTIELDPDFTEGLKDLEGFSHIILLYHFHKITTPKLSVVPFMDTVARGIFATRSPARPNAIGISTVKLLHIEGNVLFLEGVDMLNGSPLIDIKPFFARFDNRENAVSGWLDAQTNIDITTIRSDDRFDQQ